MKKYKVCVVTGTRAEYGLWKPVLLKMKEQPEIQLKIVATGAHLSTDFGRTIDEIISDGFNIDMKIECICKIDGQISMPLSTARAIEGFSRCFYENRPDMVAILGDRYEIFAAATAAAMLDIPIAHLYGGDTTEGAIDEFLRHSITKMSYLHFVSNEQSKNRVIQLGENPKRVFNVGSLGAENIKKMKLLTLRELENSLNYILDKPFSVVTFHPVTMELGTAEKQFKELLNAIQQKDNMKFIFTKANADSEGMKINQLIDEFVVAHKNCVAFESLGQLRYFSALSYSNMVIGNSSSGIYEAPLFGVPTVNIGDRQKGRLQLDTVINVEPKAEQILEAINLAEKQEKKAVCFEKNPYYKENTSKEIVNKILAALKNENINLKKKFYDLEQ